MPAGGARQLAGVSAKREQTPPFLPLYLGSPGLRRNIPCSGKSRLGSSKAKRRTPGLYWTQAWVWSLQKVHTGNTQGLLPGNHRKGDPGPLSISGLAHLSSRDRAQPQV